MQCHAGCGACCIAPSISSSIPGMPQGKPAGVRCIQLDEHNLCRIFGMAERPAVCASFSASVELCGKGAQHAMKMLNELEWLTGKF